MHCLEERCRISGLSNIGGRADYTLVSYKNGRKGSKKSPHPLLYKKKKENLFKETVRKWVDSGSTKETTQALQRRVDGRAPTEKISTGGGTSREELHRKGKTNKNIRLKKKTLKKKTHTIKEESPVRHRTKKDI